MVFLRLSCAEMLKYYISGIYTVFTTKTGILFI